MEFMFIKYAACILAGNTEEAERMKKLQLSVAADPAKLAARFAEAEQAAKSRRESHHSMAQYLRRNFN